MSKEYDPDDLVRECQTESFNALLQRRLSRRDFIKLGSSAAMLLTAGCKDSRQQDAATAALLNDQALSFTELAQGLGPALRVAHNYESQVLIRWGDPLFMDAPGFDIDHQSAAAQSQQFGFNNDYVAFLSLRGNESDSGLLVVNHEFSRPDMMFPGVRRSDRLSREQVDVEIASLGMSVVEIRLDGEQWRINTQSKYNRRITPWTAMQLAGPAARHRRLITTDSPDATQTLGTYGNCSGGITPWGTVLTAEENVDHFFSGAPDQTPEAENYRRFGLKGRGKRTTQWGTHYSRWNLNKEPAEALHVGWIVELDPFNPASKPIKHTALGRFKHEACNLIVNDSGHVVVYLGDDQRFEYIYRFVSKYRYKAGDNQRNRRLLDHGVLSVARFEDDGSLHWLPLVYGQGPLDQLHGFHSQADVVLDARKAADLLAATPMDRPEDIEINPLSGEVYAVLTGNKKRRFGETDAVNSRSDNRYGQIIKLIPPAGDHCADQFRWDVFLLAGDPQNPGHGAQYHPLLSSDGWFSRPDNAVFDTHGRLWVATDNYKSKLANGLWAMQTQGDQQALAKHFLSAPSGAEVCGPMFTPDNTTLFCAIQHPGMSHKWSASPSSLWPDFGSSPLPRSAVVAIRHKRGMVIGS